MHEGHEHPDNCEGKLRSVAHTDAHSHCAGHHHHHHHHHHHASGNLLFAFFLNLFFALIELIGGIYTGSVAILSDALHDFGDSISLGVAWRLEKYSQRKSDARFTYGYKRFSLLGALLISIILLVGSFFVITASIKRLINPGEPMAEGMLVLAIFGLIVNGVAALRLKSGHSLSERAVMLHLMEDVLGWAAVLVVSIVMIFVDLPILDPILSLAITAWILFNVYGNLKATMKVLLQGVPEGVNRELLTKAIVAIEAVSDVHDMHLWSLDGENHIITIHVCYNSQHYPDVEKQQALKERVRQLCSEHGIAHATIELDPDHLPCSMENCTD